MQKCKTNEAVEPKVGLKVVGISGPSHSLYHPAWVGVITKKVDTRWGTHWDVKKKSGGTTQFNNLSQPTDAPGGMKARGIGVYPAPTDGEIMDYGESTKRGTNMPLWERRLKISTGASWERELKEAVLREEFGVYSLGKRQYRVFPKGGTLGSYIVTVPKERDSQAHAERILTQVLQKSTRVRTLPKTKSMSITDEKGLSISIKYEGKFTERRISEEFGKKITGGAPAPAEPGTKPGTSMKSPDKEELPDDPGEEDEEGLPPKTLSDPAVPGAAKDAIEKGKEDDDTAAGDPKAAGGEAPAPGGEAPPGGGGPPQGADPAAAQAAFAQKPPNDGSQPTMPDPTQSPAQATPQAPGAPAVTMAPPAGNQGAPAAPAAAGAQVAPPAAAPAPGGAPTPAAAVDPAAAPVPPQPAAGPGVDPIQDPAKAGNPAVPTDPTQAPAQASMVPPEGSAPPDGSEPVADPNAVQGDPAALGDQPPGANSPGAGQPAQDAMGAAAQQGQPADPAAAPPGAPDPNQQQAMAPAAGPAGATAGAPGAPAPGAVPGGAAPGAPGAPDPAMGAGDPMQQGAPAQPGQAIPQGAKTIQLVLRDDMEAQRAVEWLKSMGLGNTSANGNRILTFAATPEDMTVVTRTAQAFGLELSNQLV